MFVGMPSKGCSDALQDNKVCLVQVKGGIVIPPKPLSERVVEGILTIRGKEVPAPPF